LSCKDNVCTRFDLYRDLEKTRLAISKTHNNQFWDSLTHRERFNHICKSTILNQKKRVKYSKMYWHEITANVQNKIRKGMRA
jgi:hypothetical protein